MRQIGNSHPDAPRQFDPAALYDVRAVFGDAFSLLRQGLLYWAALYAVVIAGSVAAAFLISSGMVLTGRTLQFVMPGLFLVAAFRLTAMIDGYSPVSTPGDVPWAAMWLIAASVGVSLSLFILYLTASPSEDFGPITLGLFILTVVQLQVSISLIILAAVAVAWPGVGLLVMPIALMLRRRPGDVVPEGAAEPPVFAARLVPALALIWLGMSVAMLGPLSILVIPVLTSLVHVAARRAFWGNSTP